MLHSQDVTQSKCHRHSQDVTDTVKMSQTQSRCHRHSQDVTDIVKMSQTQPRRIPFGQDVFRREGMRKRAREEVTRQITEEWTTIDT